MSRRQTQRFMKIFLLFSGIDVYVIFYVHVSRIYSFFLCSLSLCHNVNTSVRMWKCMENEILHSVCAVQRSIK